MGMSDLGSFLPLPPSPSPSSPPLLHLLLHVDALLLQQLSLGKGPVHGLGGRLRARGPLPLLPGLLGVVEAEDVALAHDDPVSCGGDKGSGLGAGNPRGVAGRSTLLGTHLTAGRWAPSPFCHSRRCQRLRRAPGSQSLRDKQQVEGQPRGPGRIPTTTGNERGWQQRLANLTSATAGPGTKRAG